MSVQAITWAYEQNDLPGMQKFVLVTLCNRCDEDWSCYPSLDRLVLDTGFKERAIRTALDALETLGCISRIRTRNSDGSLGRYRYYVHRHRMPVVLPAANAARKKSSQKQAKPAALNATTSGIKCQNLPAADAGQENRQLEPSKEIRGSVKAAFEAVWAAWPPKARKRSKRMDLVSEVFAKAARDRDPQTLVSATKAYLRENRDPQFVPALDRWLRDGKYEHYLPSGNVVSLRPDSSAWEDRLFAFREYDQWQDDWGPKPDEPGYRGAAHTPQGALL